MKSILEEHEWLAGNNPYDGKNPWAFYTDGSFKTLKDNHGGTWSTESKEGRQMLYLKWTTANGYANFVVTEKSLTSVKLDCISSGWGFMRSWKIYSKNYRDETSTATATTT